jgi:hypothetical protein
MTYDYHGSNPNETKLWVRSREQEPKPNLVTGLLLLLLLPLLDLERVHGPLHPPPPPREGSMWSARSGIVAVLAGSLLIFSAFPLPQVHRW